MYRKAFLSTSSGLIAVMAHAEDDNLKLVDGKIKICAQWANLGATTPYD